MQVPIGCYRDAANFTSERTGAGLSLRTLWVLLLACCDAPAVHAEQVPPAQAHLPPTDTHCPHSRQTDAFRLHWCAGTFLQGGRPSCLRLPQAAQL